MVTNLLVEAAMPPHNTTLDETGERLFFAGECVPSGVYVEIETHRRVRLPHPNTLPACCDGRIACYRRVSADGSMRLSGERCENMRRQQRFDALYQGSRRGVYNMVRASVRNCTDAEDITQEAFARAWTHFDRYDARYSFDAWVRRIALNLMADHFRRQQRWSRICLDAESNGFEIDQVPGDAASSACDPAARFLSGQVGEALQAVFAALPDTYKVPLLMAGEKHSYADIAAALNCPTGTIRSRIHRARVLLRRALKEQ